MVDVQSSLFDVQIMLDYLIGRKWVYDTSHQKQAPTSQGVTKVISYDLWQEGFRMIRKEVSNLNLVLQMEFQNSSIVERRQDSDDHSYLWVLRRCSAE